MNMTFMTLAAGTRVKALERYDPPFGPITANVTFPARLAA